MSNGDEQCNKEENEILSNHDAFLAAPTLDAKVQRLGENFRDGRLATVRSFAALRRLLPWRPWMVKVIASVGVLGVLGFVWAASSFSKDVQANKKCADKAQATADEAKAATAVVGEAAAVTNAKLDLLLSEKGIARPSRIQILRSAEELGLPAVDTASQDSTARLGLR